MESMDEADFHQRLEQAVEVHHPDVIVIHTGLAFTRHPDAYARVLGDVTASDPGIRFATDRRWRLEGLGLPLPMLSDEMAARLIRVLFPEASDYD